MVAQIHSRLLEAGIDSWIVSMETGDRRGTERVLSFGRRYPRVKEPFLLRRMIAGLERDGGAIDIIHSHLTQSQAFSKFAKRKTRGAKLVTTEHDTLNRRRELWFGRIFDRWLYHGYERIICISEGVQRSMLEWLPKLPAANCPVVPNGVEIERLLALPRGERKEGEPLRLLSVGRLVAKKNFSLSLRALAGLSDLDWRYTMVGDGEQRAELEALAATLGIRERVDFAGFQEEVLPFYQAADALLVPSLWEGFGLVAVEALAAGIPVLAAKVPGISEVLGSDGKVGFLLDLERIEDWTAAVQKVASQADGGVPATLARARAKEFGIEKTVRGYIKIYEEVLGMGDR